MHTRYFYVEDIGQWWEGTHSKGAPFNKPAGEEAASLAAALGFNRVTCTEVTDGSDPREGELYAPPAESPPAVPDLGGYRRAAMTALGVIRSNELMTKWPMYDAALLAENWAVAKQVLDAALADSTLTQAEHDALTGLMETHSIPSE